MNILIVIRTKIPVLSYGGTERVMWYLGKELSNLGHKVTYLAAEGSTCIFADVKTLRFDIPIESQIPEDTDIVHFNEFVPEMFSAKPYVVTIHGNRIDGTIDKNAIFVSKNHAQRFGSDSFVYNGLDWNDYGTLNNAPRKHYHFLAKAAWRVKNVRGSIDLIKQLPNEKLCVLGGYRFNFKMGIRFTMTPKADFKGMVSGKEKLKFLHESKGLFFPVLWDEPFGLAITESLYCGAPVFGTPYGSLPEIVNQEVGFLTTDKHEMIHHLKNDYHYSPKRCHEYAADLFNSNVMAKAYLAKYEQVLAGELLNATNPVCDKGMSSYSFS